MSTAEQTGPALIGRNVSKTFPANQGEVTRALDNVSVEVQRHALTAVVGPDGAGKTTFMRLVAGLMSADSGDLKVLGIDVAAHPDQVQRKIGYMPQRFGLYEDLTVEQNLDLYGALHGIGRDEGRKRHPRLMEMTALGPFLHRLAGRLSGGMKQKLGLACTLIHEPELLLLDEPTVGVDPLSRRELWRLILELVRGRSSLTVLLSTSYLDEAERCDQALVLHQGNLLAQGHPATVQDLAEGRVFLAHASSGSAARTLQARLLDSHEIVDAVPEGGAVRFVRSENEESRSIPREPTEGKTGAARIEPTPPRFEDGFMVLLDRAAKQYRASRAIIYGRTPNRRLGDSIVQVRNLLRQFGTFAAVDHINFDVRAGEIFGLLGPNGAGKTTTFRMLCGLLPASGGTLRIAGVDLRTARASARRSIGYVAQKFSLYGHLTVGENLDFFASAYGLTGDRNRRRIDWALEQFDLAPYRGTAAELLPGGFKRRLAMAAALLHEPDTLFLDEPTSGADPLARREFWRGITALAEQGVTVIVTTHFMEEAEYCDRVAILDRGRIIASGTPAYIRRHGHAAESEGANMEDAFIAIVERERSTHAGTATTLGGGR
jgi:ABC-2 type transport system ATP-binding protein